VELVYLTTIVPQKSGCNNRRVAIVGEKPGKTQIFQDQGLLHQAREILNSTSKT